MPAYDSYPIVPCTTPWPAPPCPKFNELIDQNYGIISSTSGNTYYVRILSTLDREELMRRQYALSGAQAAWPSASERTSTPWTTSDIFFLGHALGRLTVRALRGD